MQISEWLENLGLAQYADVFAAEGIDLSIVGSLSDQDLKELGVALMGHRRKIMTAAAQIGAAEDSTPAPAPPAAVAPAPAPSPPPRARDEAERRPITVMFCDLVGSTSLSSKLDAEDWRELVGSYLDEASHGVTSFGGHVLKKLGDGLMALFGYPQAQENDAERAARAGLAIFRALDVLNAKNVARGLPALAARIGLESGPVVVDQTGEVFGDAPNIAARVQSAAESGTLLVTAGVQRQVAGMFVVEDKGPHELKGVAGKPTLYRIVRASGGGRRLGARSLTPLVGRDDELALLLRRWQRAREGEGQLIQIVGEPGLGKSRLIEEFRTRIAEAPHTWVEWSSSQLLQNTPLHPVAEWGRQRFGGADVPAEQRLAELDATLAQVKLDPAEHTPLIAPLLDIPVPDSRALKLAPEEMRRRQLAAIVAWLIAGARTQPLALAFEDLHWADPTSLDLMKTLAERSAQAPLMIVATSRPEFHAPWTTRSQHGILSLIPLDRAQIRDMVATIAERHALSKDTIEGLADRTGGVPLFVEEVTRLMLEGGAQTIPPTLQQSLAARLDRLGEAREVAQIGAVLGREFSYDLLRSVASGLSVDALDAALEKLVEADLLFVEGSRPTATYRFKHALIQDAAYEILLKARRQTLHRSAAQALVASPDPQPELVAHHFTQSREKEAAVEWWGKAGDAALRRSAFQEAIAHLGKAIEMADASGSKPPREATAAPGDMKAPARAKLHSGFALATMMTKGFGAEDTRAAIARAESVSGQARTTEYWTLAYGRVSADLMRGNAKTARAGAEAFVAEAEAAGLPGHAAFGRRMLGFIKFLAGEFASARADLERALADFVVARDGPLQSAFAIDFRAQAYAYLSQTVWFLGEFEEADRLAREAIRQAEASAQPASLAAAQYCHCLYALLKDEPTDLLEAVAAIADIAERHDLKFWRAMAATYAAWAGVRLGEPRAAEFRAAFAAFPALGARMQETALLPLAAQVEAADGRREAALGLAGDGLASMAAQGLGAWRPILMLVRAGIWSSTDAARAEQDYRESHDLAVSQGSRAIALRAALALARLWAAGGRRLEAFDILAAALEGFAPTSLFPAIAQAQALVAELSETDEVWQRRRVVELRAKYAQATLIVEGHTSAAAKRAFGRLDLADLAGMSEAEQLTAFYGRWTGAIISGRFAESAEIAHDVLISARNAKRRLVGVVAQRLFAYSQYYGGAFAEAANSAKAALAQFDDSDSAAHLAALGNDLLCQTHCVAAQLFWPAGDVAASGRLMDEAMERAAALGQPFVAASVQAQNIIRLWLADRPAETLAAAEALAGVVEATGVGAWTAHAKMFVAWGTGRRSDPRAATLEVGEAWADLRARDARLYDTIAPGLLADLDLAAGDREQALRHIDEGLDVAGRLGAGYVLPLLLRLRGLCLEASDPAGAEAALREAVGIADAHGGRSLALLAALPLARFLQAGQRPVDAHDTLAPALEGFALTPEFPTIAEAQALLAALAQNEAVAVQLRQREVRAKLHSGFALATMMTQGFAADETKAALARAETSAATSRTPQYWTVLYGRVGAALAAADLTAARAAAETFLAEAEALGLKGHAAFARRAIGFQKLIRGDFQGAAADLRRALAETDDKRDAALSDLFGMDVVATAMAACAQSVWYLGQFDESARLTEAALAHAQRSGRPVSWLHANANRLFRGLQGGQPAVVLEFAEQARARADEHDLKYWKFGGAAWADWARARLGLPLSQDFSNYLAKASEMGVKLGLSLFHGMQADVELASGRKPEALAAIDRALGHGAAKGEAEWTSWLLRIRATTLADEDPQAAETDYREALEVAQRQGSPVLALLTVLSLAKFLNDRGRALEAHDALATALEGFAPTPHLPAIAEAQALLAELSRNDAVAAELRQRQVRAKLHSGYALASMMTKGFAAEETKAALERAGALVQGARTSELWRVRYGQLIGELMASGPSAVRSGAEAFVAEAEAAGEPGHASVARRMLGNSLIVAGDFASAAAILRRAAADLDEVRDACLSALYGHDVFANAQSTLAQAVWYLGEIEEAERHARAALERAERDGYVISQVQALACRFFFAVQTQTLDGSFAISRRILALAEAHGLANWSKIASNNILALRVIRGEPLYDDYLEDFERIGEFGGRVTIGSRAGVRAEVELAVGRPDEALVWIDRALAIFAEIGEGEFTSFRLRRRATILAALESAAEPDFRAALDLARAQGSPTLTLLAALDFAKHLRRAERYNEARDILAASLPALAPTPLLPAIAEAKSLLRELQGTA